MTNDRISRPEIVEALLDPELTGDPESRAAADWQARQILNSQSRDVTPIPGTTEGATQIPKPLPPAQDVGFLKDRANPTSVISSLPPDLQEYVQAIPDELLEWSEAELEAKLKPTTSLIRLRHNFWHEMDRKLANVGSYKDIKSKYVRIDEVCVGAGDRALFRKLLKSDPFAAAYIFLRPASYERALAAAHATGLERITKILQVEAVTTNPDGTFKIDHKTAALQLKIYEMLDLRLKGAPTQRIEQKTATVHLGNVPAPQGGSGTGSNQGILELEKKVAALEHKTSLPSGSSVSGFEEPK